MPPASRRFRLFRPFFFFATCVVALMVAFIGAYLAPDGMRRIKQWDAEITADVLTNILQPGRFAQLDQNLTIRISRSAARRRAWRQSFVDDRRDPQERVTIIADHGTVLKTDNRLVPDFSRMVISSDFEVGKRDSPRWWRSAVYAFRHVENSRKARDCRAWNSRTLHLGADFRPTKTTPIFKQTWRAVPAPELHDRFMAPVYPFAFAVLTFAFSSARPAHQRGRAAIFSIGGSILAVFGPPDDRLRLLRGDGEDARRGADPVFDAVRIDRDRLVDDSQRRGGGTAGPP